MVKKLVYAVTLFAGIALPATAQVADASQASAGGKDSHKVVVVTGARFSYTLVQRWIDEFNKEYPEIQVIIESRGSADPNQYDVLAEVYEHDEKIKKNREYLQVGRYSILPVATAGSGFAKTYGEKGLDNKLVKQVFFHDIFADQNDKEKINVPFTVYTRFQKAGAPVVFAKHYGFEQKDINGKSIAGSDEHLLKALLRDSTGISYLPIPLIYDPESRTPVAGLTVIPVDLDGNGKVKADERGVYSDLDQVLQQLEDGGTKNLPTAFLHLSVDKQKVSNESLKFLKWVEKNGETYLKEYGYLSAGEVKTNNKSFDEFVSGRGL